MIGWHRCSIDGVHQKSRLTVARLTIDLHYTSGGNSRRAWTVTIPQSRDELCIMGCEQRLLQLKLSSIHPLHSSCCKMSTPPHLIRSTLVAVRCTEERRAAIGMTIIRHPSVILDKHTEDAHTHTHTHGHTHTRSHTHGHTQRSHTRSHIHTHTHRIHIKTTPKPQNCIVTCVCAMSVEGE